ncbi:ArsR/SmtB family transcription factor [Pyrococcus abyssi]|uniref:Transcriptional regulator n=1 Tax=Pyrococcus abyssi (strain GE5 / Orsay) TaxID=272844 RepID=Q9V1W9_PYRAB|nr:ArsR family transcriptional regulator [Pyrococcus abyssi]CAB49229.1 Putative transcriptional regulator [Pyrococcus abyssi GE5]CCE69684.1 TPA: transcriptional regulatory protein arsR family [Pyrococcus abyssi GE5]
MGEELDMLLDVLGNETRRRILLLLTKRPYFVSELSQELGVGQKAVLEHLRILEEAGLIESRIEKIPRGRPRKYYMIKRGLRLEILLTPTLFGSEMYEPKDIRKSPEYEQARELIKSTEPIDVKMRELAEFLHELDERIKEIIEEKRELEEVKILVETYIENVMRRMSEENRQTLEKIFKEIERILPKDYARRIKEKFIENI